MVRRPYIVIILFYISGKVTVNSKPIELKRYYHISSKCPLLVKVGEGKLGVWVFKLGK